MTAGLMESLGKALPLHEVPALSEATGRDSIRQLMKELKALDMTGPDLLTEACRLGDDGMFYDVTRKLGMDDDELIALGKRLGLSETDVQEMLDGQ